jgi:hypothetical protein
MTLSLSIVGAVFAKIETTPGVEAAPTTSGSPNDYILALEANYAPNFSIIDRKYLRPSISNTPHLMGRQLATLTFTTEVFGTGVAAVATDVTTQSQATPKWADLLEGCAFAGAAVSSPAGKVYTPLTSAQKTLTLYCYYDGMLHKLTGAMGTFTLSAPAGQIATMQWTFTGVYNDPVATSTPTPTPPTITPPLVESIQFAIGSTASTVFLPGNVNIDVANTVTPRTDANSAKGFNSMIITARAPQLSFSPESVPEASHPFWGDFSSATAKAINFHIGSSAGNKVLVTVPNVQTSNLQYSDRDGIRIYEVTAMASTTTATGNDEVSFKFI